MISLRAFLLSTSLRTNNSTEYLKCLPLLPTGKSGFCLNKWPKREGANSKPQPPVHEPWSWPTTLPLGIAPSMPLFRLHLGLSKWDQPWHKSDPRDLNWAKAAYSICSSFIGPNAKDSPPRPICSVMGGLLQRC